jgi:glycosyltransferase involved in cell wall biosynthesis
MEEMDVSIVIPVYNEEDNIKPLHESLKSVMDGLGIQYEVIFVDDGSTDSTFPLLEEIQSRDKTVTAISMRRNFGQTAAFVAGFDRAGGDIIVTMDGDMQNDPQDIPRLLDVMKGCDLVSGWRKDRKDAFITRRLPSSAANWLISVVTGVRLHDYGCSLKAYRREVVKNLRLYGEMHRFIPAIANWHGANIKEEVVNHHPRLRGKSKYGISRTIKVLLDLITVKFLQSFSTKPIQFFGPLGLGSGMLGFLILLYLTAEKVVFGASIGGRPLLLLGVLLLIIGFQLIGMGLLGEMLVRVYHESQRKPVYAIKRIIGPETQ